MRPEQVAKIVPTWLSKSESLYVTIIDWEGNYSYVNELFINTFGVSEEELIGKPFGITVHPDDHEKCSQAAYQCKEQPEKVVQLDIRKPTGNAGLVFWTKWELSNYLSTTGESLGVICLGSDATIEKKYAHDLSKLEEKMQSLLEQTSDIALEIGLDGEIHNFNPIAAEAAEHFVGKTLVKGAKLEDFLLENLLEQTNEAFYQASKGENREVEIEFVILENVRTWFRVKFSPVYDEQRQVKAVAILAQNISPQKQVEVALLQEEKKNELIISTMQEGIVVQNLEGEIIACNKSAEQILGLSREDMTGRTSMDPEWQAVDEYGQDLPGHLHPPMRTLNARKPLSDVVMGIHKPSGELTWLSVNTQLFYDEKQQELIGVFSVFHDITERKNMEDNLATKTRRLNAIIEGTNVGTWEWNIETGETIYNHKWAEMLGYQLDEIETDSLASWKKLTHPDDYKRSNELLAKHFKGESDYYESEVRMKHKEGHWVWIMDKGKVSKWSQEGKALLISGTHQDISERKQFEAQILAQNEKLKEIAFLQSHSLRQYIARILGLWNLIEIERKQEGSIKRLNQYIDFIGLSAKEMDQAIHEIVSKTTT